MLISGKNMEFSICLNSLFKNASHGETDNASWLCGKNYIQTVGLETFSLTYFIVQYE